MWCCRCRSLALAAENRSCRCKSPLRVSASTFFFFRREKKKQRTDPFAPVAQAVSVEIGAYIVVATVYIVFLQMLGQQDEPFCSASCAIG